MSGDAAHEPALPAAPDTWTDLTRLTPARIALGRAGGSLPTREILRFGLAHAQARDAVHLPLDGEGVAAGIAALGLATLRVESAAPSRALYLRRPDLGRRLSDGSRASLSGDDGAIDLAIVVADGLSSAAVHAHAAPLVAALLPHLARARRRLAPVVIATGARVALGDEIATRLGARSVAVLIGERPGLSAPDSLGVYLTLDPAVGCTDERRNCLSNIRHGGLGYDEAAFRLAWLIERAFALGRTGVSLKDESGAFPAVPGASPSATIPPPDREA